MAIAKTTQSIASAQTKRNLEAKKKIINLFEKKNGNTKMIDSVGKQSIY